MKRKDVLAIGALVLLAVIVGAMLATGGPDVIYTMLQGVMKLLPG